MRQAPLVLVVLLAAACTTTGETYAPVNPVLTGLAGGGFALLYNDSEPVNCQAASFDQGARCDARITPRLARYSTAGAALNGDGDAVLASYLLVYSLGPNYLVPLGDGRYIASHSYQPFVVAAEGTAQKAADALQPALEWGSSGGTEQAMIADGDTVAAFHIGTLGEDLVLLRARFGLDGAYLDPTPVELARVPLASVEGPLYMRRSGDRLLLAFSANNRFRAMRTTLAGEPLDTTLLDLVPGAVAAGDAGWVVIGMDKRFLVPFDGAPQSLDGGASVDLSALGWNGDGFVGIGRDAAYRRVRARFDRQGALLDMVDFEDPVDVALASDGAHVLLALEGARHAVSVATVGADGSLTQPD